MSRIELIQVVMPLCLLALVPGAPARAEDGDAEPSAEAAPEAGAAKVGEAAPELELKDLAGETHTLAAHKGKVIVIEWVAPDCPYVAKQHEQGTIKALRAKYEERGVVWLAVASRGAAKPEALKPKVEAWGLGVPVLLDADGAVARRYGAERTPHVFVIDGEGKLRYSGAVEDEIAADDAAAPKAGTNYVERALDAIFAGQPVEPATTKAYGCPIE